MVVNLRSRHPVDRLKACTSLAQLVTVSRYVCLHHKSRFRDFNSWIVSSNTPLANNDRQRDCRELHPPERKSVGSLIAIIAAGSPTTQLMIFDLFVFAAISAPFRLRTKECSQSLSLLVEYLRLHPDKLNVVANYS